MTEAVVERMIDNICRFTSSLDDLFEMLQTNLDDGDGVIVDGDRDGTKETVYGSEAQIGLMRRMWDAIQQEPVDGDTIFQIREETEAEAAGEGPLFFKLMVTVYRWWVQRWEQENAGDSSSEGDVDVEEGDEDDMLDIDVPRGRVTRAGASIGALMNKLEELGSVTTCKLY
jgi:hypothetical protein